MSERLDPILIARQMGAAYAGFESYQDTGLIETCFHPGRTDEYTTKRAFITKFRRPNLFLFEQWEVGESEERRVIWSDGEAAYCNYFGHSTRRITDALPPELQGGGESELQMAIACTLEAQAIAVMLMADIGGRSLCNVANWVFEDATDLNGESCYRLGSKTEFDGVQTIWISKERSVLVKIDEQYAVKPAHFEHFSVHRVTSYTDLRPDARIPLEDFDPRDRYPVTEGAIIFSGGSMIMEDFF